MFKSLAKKLLADCTDRLPPGARGVVIDRLARSSGYELMQALGRRYGVRHLSVLGDYGMIEGSIDDAVILPRYAHDKHWAQATNTFFATLFETRGGGSYLDIGANIGLTTIPIARNPQVICKAFEPEPRNLRYLQRNVRNNCVHDNVEVFGLAVYDQPATVDFELAEDNLGDHRIRTTDQIGKFAEQHRNVIRVKADRLDNVLDPGALAGPIAAKIDTQGAEAQVFLGGRDVLGRADAIAFEYWPYGLARAGGDVRALVDFTADHFAFGAVLDGDRAGDPAWEPIRHTVDRLREWDDRERESAFGYHDVFVRK